MKNLTKEQEFGIINRGGQLPKKHEKWELREAGVLKTSGSFAQCAALRKSLRDSGVKGTVLTIKPFNERVK